jgi:hypothetical protein
MTGVQLRRIAICFNAAEYALAARHRARRR